MAEAPDHPHNAARNTFITVADVVQAAPAPRFSRTAAGTPSVPPTPGEHTDVVLQEIGIGAALVAELRASGAVF